MDPTLRLLMRYKRPHKIRQLFLDNQRIPSVEILCLSPPSSSSDTTDACAPLPRFVNLLVLSLTDVHCTSLRGFPSLPELRRLALADNKITNGLGELVGKVPMLEYLDLSNNRIGDFATLKPLRHIESLRHLSLIDCEITAKQDYRARIFEMLPFLETLDGQDRDGQNVDSEEDSDEDEDMDGEPMMVLSSQDSDDDSELEDSDEEASQDGMGDDDDALYGLPQQRRQYLAALGGDIADADEDDEDDDDYVSEPSNDGAEDHATAPNGKAASKRGKQAAFDKEDEEDEEDASYGSDDDQEVYSNGDVKTHRSTDSRSAAQQNSASGAEDGEEDEFDEVFDDDDDDDEEESEEESDGAEDGPGLSYLIQTPPSSEDEDSDNDEGWSPAKRKHDSLSESHDETAVPSDRGADVTNGSHAATVRKTGKASKTTKKQRN
ncbi:hypothetical protein THASP1DRAFT_27294 [Thamnocephalis sphaerospora]|uniref:U2A'/phosphoprotein 32 family A C-terminal domain-containing protein n=1 Tax=Thamnocephalis sphaerospora TaxID=78915 RepID=A0A4V1IXG0_9FUNG|nr:hypothetical protein THASP1DRAFT_27294 [Thamnocephalis sphaerospora]|eukprot:RKP10929.1 hypothetical protein THASP1DRAFT_27294 [Thamnocephalis sphaerospora]